MQFLSGHDLSLQPQYIVENELRSQVSETASIWPYGKKSTNQERLHLAVRRGEWFIRQTLQYCRRVPSKNATDNGNAAAGVR